MNDRLVIFFNKEFFLLKETYFLLNFIQNFYILQHNKLFFNLLKINFKYFDNFFVFNNQQIRSIPKSFFKLPVLSQTLWQQTTTNVDKTHFIVKTANLSYYQNIFFLFTFFFNKNILYPHFNFDYYILKSFKNKLIFIYLNKFIKRWQNSLNLIYNLFYYELNPLIFSNRLFRKETLALNWSYNIFDFDLWKYHSLFFSQKKIQATNYTLFFYEKIKIRGTAFFFVMDALIHFKNLNFFKKNFFFLIGVVNIFSNPWIFDYPFFLFSDNYITNLFFFKLFIFFFKKANFIKYASKIKIFNQTLRKIKI